ncbi:hypothetical protein FZC76_06030 [Sutcliffiella horikoshii]|uniref:Uncharacterized protein n=1 Tax=Sutcliffiella horikoshii TaxID=79883 RepID=A0A5D4T6F7_9BACI|nr:hypothetical protein [Sutcliffiella horikoshii]TYS69786.1 hypothetical protein FZC76_06030 [Sutcliffiella horikoshii]
MGIYNQELNLRTHISKHFHLHPKSIEHILKDYHVNSSLNHALVSSLKEKIIINLRNHKVWDRYSDEEIERLIEQELRNYIERSITSNQNLIARTNANKLYITIRYSGTVLLTIFLLIYTVYQVMEKDLYHSINNIQYIKRVIDPSDILLLLFIGIVSLLFTGPLLEKMYGSVKFLYLFFLPGCIVFPFQNGTIVELLFGCISGSIGFYLGLTVLRRRGITLNKVWMIWGYFCFYLALFYYKIGVLFDPFPLISASIIGLLLSIWIKPKVHVVK